MHAINTNFVRSRSYEIFHTKIYNTKVSLHENFQIYGMNLTLMAWHAATGKGRHITRCTLCIKDSSLLRTIQCGPTVSIIQRFHCIVFCTFKSFHKISIWITSLFCIITSSHPPLPHILQFPKLSLESGSTNQKGFSW